MPSVTIQAQLCQASEYCEQDQNGDIVSRESRTRFLAGLPITATSKENQVDLTFYVWGEVPVSVANRFPEGRSRLNAVADAIMRSKAVQLSAALEWQTHGKIDVRVTEDLRESPESGPPVEIQIEVMPLCLEHLKRETKRMADVEAAFEKAKAYISEKLEHPLGNDASKVLAAAKFITACDKASFDPFEAYRDYDFVDRLNEGLDAMMRSPKFLSERYQRGRERAGEAAFLLHCPLYWLKVPPDPATLMI